MRQVLSITRKELEGYFGSPLAIIFLGAFLAVELFIFFTIETFFARGLADVRPLFQWMPVLLIFLLAALTMRQWSEEQRSGTLEVLLTLPVSLVKLVLGKFLAVMALIGLALALTLPLPVMTAMLGNLDWGPVVGGYLAALLMAAAYAAIGLFVSSRTDNQIVALITTVLVGGLFYLLGTSGVTDFLSAPLSDIFWALGTGSRFESIERGVIDLRDLVYYLSLAGIFLSLNVLSLDSQRWSQKQAAYRQKMLLTTGLIVANLLLVNLWLYPLNVLRLDLTAGREYTLSTVSKDLLANLQEPLLIRGYISAKTHPLLAPLVPAIRDMLREYEIASGGMVTAEVLDPLEDPELEAEANQTYGIQPTPFQVAGRYEASVINSYFDILIRYGDQSEVLSFSDIIEVIPNQDSIDVRLRNLEYDLTSTIKKVVYGFQSVESVLAQLEEPVRLTLFETPDYLPDYLSAASTTIRLVASQIQAESGGKLIFEVINPDDPTSQVTRQVLSEQIGLQPLPTSLFSSDSYYLHMILQNGDQAEVIYPSSEMTEADIRTAIESALKRTSSGFLKVVGFWAPAGTPTQDIFGNTQQPLSTYNLIAQQLSQDYTFKQVDLSTGQVPVDVDVLVVIAPQDFTDMERFAIDQYLMRGGSVIVAASNYSIGTDFTGLLTLNPVLSGARELLAAYGVDLSTDLVMDTQNTPFPVTVSRDAGGFTVQEIQAVDYPFFVDIRTDGMNQSSPILGNVPALTVNWASPIVVADAVREQMTVTDLLYSSAESWLTSDSYILPDFTLYPELGFPIQGEQKTHLLAVALQGAFRSVFAGQNPPTPATGLDLEAAVGSQGAVIESSPDTARLVVIGSASFVDDFVLELSSAIEQDRYLNNLTFVQNAVDWSTEDLDLLTIRARGTYTRLLANLDESEQSIWEGLNYGVALIALVGIYGFWQYRKHNQPALELLPVEDEN